MLRDLQECIWNPYSFPSVAATLTNVRVLDFEQEKNHENAQTDGEIK
jgi:hypothetical protein